MFIDLSARQVQTGRGRPMKTMRSIWIRSLLVVTLIPFGTACLELDDGDEGAAAGGRNAGTLGAAGRAGGPGDAGSDTAPRVPLLESEWMAIEPGGDTTCARGDEFRFFVRGGTLNKLVIVFDGGGAC